jgi:hypothetical protein
MIAAVFIAAKLATALLAALAQAHLLFNTLIWRDAPIVVDDVTP